MIRGANLEDTNLQSDALLLSVVLAYDTINFGPKLLKKPKTIVAEKSKRTIYQLGQIADEENDLFHLEEWSLSTDEQYSWISFRNNTDQDKLSFEILPPESITP